MRCPHCNAELGPDDRFCPECGRPVSGAPEAPSRCANCGAAVGPDDRFCPECGRPVRPARQIRAEAPPSVPPSVPPPTQPPPRIAERKIPSWTRPVVGVVGFLAVVIVAVLAIPSARSGLLAALVGGPTGSPTVTPTATSTRKPVVTTPAQKSADLAATSQALQTLNAEALATASAQAMAASTAQAQATEAVLAIASITAQAQSDATGEANARATAQAQATTGAQALATTNAQATANARATGQAQATANADATNQAQAQATTNAQATIQAQPTATTTPTLVPTATSAPTLAPTAQGPPGLVLDFEREITWQRGDEPHGEFMRSAERARSGSYSGKLSYAFPAITGNYVVFLPRPAVTLAGRPTGLVAWVYGDGSGHHLNAWVRDASGEVRAYTFGRITHQGWSQLTAAFDEGRGWPNGHISGTDDGVLSYPVSLYALVLDGVPDGQASSGAVYMDDVFSTEQPITPSPASPTPAPTSPPVGDVQVVFEFDWGSGWIGVENHGGWAQASNGHKYVTELGFLSLPESLERLKSVVPANWRAKLINRASVGWVSCVTDICQEHTSDDTQRLITNQVYFRDPAWTSLVNDYLAGGWQAVTQNPHYAEIQRKAFEPIGSVPNGPVIGFRFTQIE